MMMIKLVLLPAFIILSCGSTKQSKKISNTDSVTTAVSTPKNEADTLKNTEPEMVALPKCIKNKIDSFKLKEAHERPQKVTEYSYNGKKVYYITMPCCDFYNEVYDENCNYLGAPDGGFTGKGDGKLPDFAKLATNEKVVWQPSK